jgi:serine/threonine protein kinase
MPSGRTLEGRKRRTNSENNHARWYRSLKYNCSFIPPPPHLFGPLPFRPALWRNAWTFMCSGLCLKYNTGNCLGVRKVSSGKATWFRDFWYVHTEVMSYAISKLSILESLHDRHYVHLDVKPENFALGIGELSNQVFLIDFGLAQLFRNPTTDSQTMQINGSSTIGTVRYSSINCHLGLTPSRRDDLESLVYAIAYLAKGSLPWQGIIVQPGQIHQDEVLRVK